MFSNYKVVCVTPAGRRRYLSILAPYILGSPLVDEYHLWKNTVVAEDIQYIEDLASGSTRVKVIEPILPPVKSGTQRQRSVSQFYPNCVDPETIYIKFDDDVVFVEPCFFERFLRFRIDHPEYFLIFPNIINNAICTYVQARRGHLITSARVQPWSMDRSAWESGRFAEQLHRTFLSSVRDGAIDEWHFGKRLLSLCWFSINCMAWFGSDFHHFKGVMPEGDEEFLTVLKPAELNRINCIYGDVVVSHFAFYTQREHMDETGLLEEYRTLLRQDIPQSRNRIVVPKPINIWTPRLLDAIAEIRTATCEQLNDAGFLADTIRLAGLAFDSRSVYGNDERFMNAGFAGLWQHPVQLAKALLYLRQFRLRSVIELGTGSGWTSSVVLGYLMRFNPDIKMVTVDARNLFSAYEAVKDILPLTSYPGMTSSTFEGQKYDLTIIDCARTFDGCRADYERLGRFSDLCMFQGINDKFVDARLDAGGVPRFWSELKSSNSGAQSFVEFCDHSEGERIMGLGILVQATAEYRVSGTGRESNNHL